MIIKQQWSGDMVKGTFPPILALICLTGSEKTGLTGGRRTDVGRLLDDRSSAVQQHKVELKIGNSNLQSTFVRTIGRKIQDKFEISKRKN